MRKLFLISYITALGLQTVLALEPSVLENLHPVKMDNHYVYIDQSGAVHIDVAEEVYSARSFIEGMAQIWMTGEGAGTGFIDSSGKVVIRSGREFEINGNFSDGLARVQNGKRCGYINKKGKLVIPIQFNECADFEDKVAGVSSEGKTGVIDLSGKFIFEASPEDYSVSSEGLLAIRKGNKWGYLDTTGKIVIEPKFDAAEKFSEGLAAIKLKNKIGFIDKAGKIVIDPKFENAGLFAEGLATASIKGRYGYIDRLGKFILDPIYEQAEPFSRGVALVHSDNVSTMIDRKGKKLYSGSFYTTGENQSSDGLFRVWVNRQIGFINRKGEMVIEPQFLNASRFHGGIAEVWEFDGFPGSLINTKGKYIPISDSYTPRLEPKCESAVIRTGERYAAVDQLGKVRFLLDPKVLMATNFVNGLATVWDGTEYFYIDNAGKILFKSKNWLVNFPAEGFGIFNIDNSAESSNVSHFINLKTKEILKGRYLKANHFSEGLAAVKTSSGWQYINEKEEVILRPKFEEVESFSEGLALVTNHPPHTCCVSGFINRTGEVAIELKYDSADSFSEGLAVVGIDGKYGFIDRSGNLVIKLQFDEAKSFREGLAAVRINKKWGFINSKGEFKIPPEFNNVGSFSEGLAAVEIKNGVNRWGYIDKTGKVVIAPQYLSVKSFCGGFAKVYGLAKPGIKDLPLDSGYINNQGGLKFH